VNNTPSLKDMKMNGSIDCWQEWFILLTLLAILGCSLHLLSKLAIWTLRSVWSRAWDLTARLPRWTDHVFVPLSECFPQSWFDQND
jgi:hypothetical protein